MIQTVTEHQNSEWSVVEKVWMTFVYDTVPKPEFQEESSESQTI